MSTKRTVGTLVLAAALTPALVLAQTPAPQAPAPAGAAQLSGPASSGAASSLDQGASSEYVLGPEDVVEFDVLGTSDRTRARIYSDGTIQTNFGVRVPAAGKTPRELGADLAKALKAGGYYADPVVNVEIVGFASRYVTVLGAVGNPGLIPINRSYHLSEIMARVGGARGDGADYVVVRPEKGEEKRYSIDKLASGDPTQDPLVAPGDKIFIPQADIFYISGQVRSPGSYPLKTGMTIGQAIAKGGGLTDSGSDKKVTVVRGGKKVKLKSEDPVQANDVLTIGERLF